MVNITIRKIDQEAIKEYLKQNLKLEVVGYYGRQFQLKLILEEQVINQIAIDVDTQVYYIDSNGRSVPCMVNTNVYTTTY
jgi:hypothetical protein